MNIFEHCSVLVLLLTNHLGSAQSDCNDEDNHCTMPKNPLRIKRQVTNNQNYTCSNDLIGFTCTQEGRFPDLADTSCTWYFECTRNSQGAFLHRYAQCLEHKFSPVLQKCTSEFKCPCEASAALQTTSTPGWWCSDTTIPEFNCKKIGRYPDLRDNTCKQYLLCSKLHNGTWLKTNYKCQNSVFDPVNKKCNADYTCPCLRTTTAATTTTTTESSSTSIPKYFCRQGYTTYVSNFHCSQIGRYPDLGDSKCQRYFLCSLLRNGTWVKTRYACKDSTFDPGLKKCSIHYPCPCDETTTTTTKEVTAAPCTPTATSFKCTSNGRFDDPSDIWCKDYFLCTLLRNGTWLKTSYTCSGSAFFDPDEKKCSIQYICPCSTETTTIAANTPSACSSSGPDFECAFVGRFPNLKDFECRKYFLCSQYKNGTWSKKSYSCIGAFFDPIIGKCSVSYVCPCSSQTVKTHTTISTPTTTTSLSSSSCAPPLEPLPDFKCAAIGRFPDLADPNCKKYFLCSKLNNGTWIKWRYACKSSTFEPHIQKCNTAYPCPCLTYYTTPFDTYTRMYD